MLSNFFLKDINLYYVVSKFENGQGLGNQLWLISSIVAISKRLKFTWIIRNKSLFKHFDFIYIDLPLCQNKCCYSLSRKCGEDTDLQNLPIYNEHVICIKFNDCSIGISDFGWESLNDSFQINGYFQNENLIKKFRNFLNRSIKRKYSSHDKNINFENTVFFNVRGGHYKPNPELLLEKSYWSNAKEYFIETFNIKSFKIITDDVEYCNENLSFLGDILDINVSKTFYILENAKYLVLSNSSFAFFPTFMSNKKQHIIAPKYWARYNTSDGFWGQAEHIYKKFLYIDKQKKIWTPDACIIEESNKHKNFLLSRQISNRNIIFRIRSKLRFILVKLNILKFFSTLWRVR